MKQYQARTDDSMNVEGVSVIHNLPARVSSSVREYLCYKAYLVMYNSEECTLQKVDMVQGCSNMTGTICV
jgi:hypothetical protein